VFLLLFPFSPTQQIANVLLILTAALIGVLCYILGEGKHRRAFVEAKQSLEVKTLIEEQSAEQVRRNYNFSL
jgi:adenylate cyclase 3